MAKFASARLDDDTVVVAREDGRYAKLSSQSRILRGSQSDGDEPLTVPLARGLLEGAIFAGREVGAAGREPPPQPPLTRIQWALNLISSYQTTIALPRSLLIAAVRLHEAERYDQTDFVLKKYDEEKWHYRLALADLTAMGFDAESLVAAIEVRSASMVCEHVLREARNCPPIGVIGMAYVGERASLEVDQPYIDRINGLFPERVRPTRCLRVHSAVGSDAGHVEDVVRFVAQLDRDDRQDVLTAVFRAAQDFFEFAWHRQSDAEFVQLCTDKGIALPTDLHVAEAPERQLVQA